MKGTGARRGGGGAWAANKNQMVRPDGTLRRSQVVTAYGPGAMVDLVGDAVLIGGLEHWEGPKMEVISEPRLCASINARRRKAQRAEINTAAAFKSAPVGDDQQPSRANGIRAVEFPAWFVCQNPRCRALVHAWNGLERKGDHYVHHCDDRKASITVPVRFVAACPRGHIEEFPWIKFVHGGTVPGAEPGAARACGNPRLVLDEGSSGDFSELWVHCRTCGVRRPMSNARAPMALPSCRAERPWLGSEGREESCEEDLRLLVRTASDAYFSLVESALSIPPMKELALRAAVDAQWEILKVANEALLPAFRAVPAVRDALEGYSDAEVLATIRARLEGKPLEHGPVRTAEYRQFLSAPEEIPGKLAAPTDTFFATRAKRERGLAAEIDRVVLLHKLREVRAQVGFTRLLPTSSDLQGEYQVVPAELGLHTDWLPATELRGEGVFLMLDEARVKAWEARPAVRKRAQELRAGYARWSQQVKEAPDFPGVRFYLLHSLSHLLMTALSLECGYSASAIRERIYCSLPEEETFMAGVLLATGSAGTEGTLGGLVEQGRVIGEHLRAAWEMGSLCANDPVCGHHTPRDDKTGRDLEGAACHGCLFVAECSCERFNQYLDRGLVVPAIGSDPDVAFFREAPSDESAREVGA